MLTVRTSERRRRGAGGNVARTEVVDSLIIAVDLGRVAMCPSHFCVLVDLALCALYRHSSDAFHESEECEENG
jgi:hypothetical protein